MMSAGPLWMVAGLNPASMGHGNLLHDGEAEATARALAPHP